jgi:hypothetical protein
VTALGHAAWQQICASEGTDNIEFLVAWRAGVPQTPCSAEGPLPDEAPKGPAPEPR